MADPWITPPFYYVKLRALRACCRRRAIATNGKKPSFHSGFGLSPAARPAGVGCAFPFFAVSRPRGRRRGTPSPRRRTPRWRGFGLHYAWQIGMRRFATLRSARPAVWLPLARPVSRWSTRRPREFTSFTPRFAAPLLQRQCRCRAKSEATARAEARAKAASTGRSIDLQREDFRARLVCFAHSGFAWPIKKIGLTLACAIARWRSLRDGVRASLRAMPAGCARHYNYSALPLLTGRRPKEPWMAPMGASRPPAPEVQGVGIP